MGFYKALYNLSCLPVCICAVQLWATCESKRFLAATDVSLLSQLPVVSSVTSVRFVVSHVNCAGLDKAALDNTVYSDPSNPL